LNVVHTSKYLNKATVVIIELQRSNATQIVDILLCYAKVWTSL